MLVLSRGQDESIVIELEDGRRITVTNVGMRPGGIVRLGVTADKSILVHRDTVMAEIDAERAKRGGR